MSEPTTAEMIGEIPKSELFNARRYAELEAQAERCKAALQWIIKVAHPSSELPQRYILQESDIDQARAALRPETKTADAH